MRWLLLFAIGCDSVLHLQTVSVARDGGLPTCTSGVPLLVDDFQNSVPCAPWGMVHGTGSAHEGSGQLELDLANNDDIKCATTNDIAFPAGGLLVQIIATPAGTGSTMSLESPKLGAELYDYAGLLNLAPPGGGPRRRRCRSTAPRWCTGGSFRISRIFRSPASTRPTA